MASRLIRRSLAGFILMLLAMNLPAQETGRASIEAEEAVRALNRVRTEAGLMPLAPDQAAALSALRHADELAERLSLSHMGNDGSRVTERYRRVGGTGLSAGENLGAGDSVGRIVAAWMNSPGHRANMMNPKWRKLGVGVHVLESGRLIIVAVFSDSRFEVLDRTRGVAGEDPGAPAEITGRYLLRPGMMPRSIVLIHGLSEYRPVSVREEDGSLILCFRFPVPGEWLEGRPAAFRLKAVERGTETTTDLLILHP